MEKATFAAGCFWQIEEAYRELDGVTSTRVGYIGGSTREPSYEQVCSGRTGHAEALEVDFDPDCVSYQELLERFWQIHDPTTRNRQGWDVGSQYRSAVFFHSPGQEQAAIASRERAQDARRKPIVTEITPASEFWEAEGYHQCYLATRSSRSLISTLLGRR